MIVLIVTGENKVKSYFEGFAQLNFMIVATLIVWYIFLVNKYNPKMAAADEQLNVSILGCCIHTGLSLRGSTLWSGS